MNPNLCLLDETGDAETKPTPSILVLDIPLLLERGWDAHCDEILMLDVPEEIRVERAHQRGWSLQEFKDREGAQWPLERKRQAATKLWTYGDDESVLEGLLTA